MLNFMRTISSTGALVAVVVGLPALGVFAAALLRKRVRAWIVIVAALVPVAFYFALLSGHSRGDWMLLGERVTGWVLLALFVLGPGGAIAVFIAGSASPRLKAVLSRGIRPGRAAIIVLLHAAVLLGLAFTADVPMRGHRAPGAVCQGNVIILDVVLRQYAADHDGRFPDSLGALLKEPYLSTAKVFFCPAQWSVVPEGLPKDWKDAGPDAFKVLEDASDYVLVKGLRRDDPGDPAERVLLYEKPPGHGAGCAVIFVDGRGRIVSEAKLRQMLAEHSAR